MIVVRIGRDKDGFIRQYSIKGHAGYAEQGLDIICAAASAVAYTAVGALEELAGVSGYVEQDGLMEARIPDIADETKKYTVWVILESMVIGLEQIEYRYKDFIKIIDEEV